MRSFNALLRKDLKSYFAQPTGYVLLVIFVGVVSYLFFFVSAFRTNEEASIRELFSVQSLFTLPWLLVIFIPASTMRLLAEEQRDGTLEILLTQPVQTWSVLLAKFVAPSSRLSEFPLRSFWLANHWTSALSSPSTLEAFSWPHPLSPSGCSPRALHATR
jgi:ABC-type transport system involved in cytochrome c biogenesis permease component